MVKKLKGKQKQEDKPNPANVASLPPTSTDSFNATGMPAAQAQHVVLTEEPPQQHTWGTGWAQRTESTGAGGWGASADNVGGAWATNTENVGEPWGMGGGNIPQQQGSDDSSLGQSEILQPPPSHAPSVLAPIPEQTPLTPYNQNRRPLSDIGETNDEYSDWENPDSRTPQHWGDNPQSHTLTATIAPSAMGSPPLQPTVSLAEAAATAQKDLQKQGKTTTASEVARRMEESRRHSVDPQHLAAQQDQLRAAHAVHHAANKKPKSSASAAAAAMEASHFKHQNAKQRDTTQAQPPPGKTTWTHPKPFMEGWRDPAHILPDPSWIHTGGNTWSRKHLASKSASAVNWAQPIETAWPQPQHPYPPPSQSQRPSHKKHRSHTGFPSHRSHRPSASQQHQSWHSWGKERWVESPGTETESDEDAINIVDSWGTYNSQPTDQRRSRDKRSRRKDDDNENWGGQGGWPQQEKTAWGEQRHEGGVPDSGWAAGGGDQWGGWDQDHKGGSGRGQDWDQDKGGSGWGQDQHPSGRGQDNGGSGWGQDQHPSGRGQDKGGSGWDQDKNASGRGQETRRGQDQGHGLNDSNWNQDPNWGKDKGSGWGEGRQQGGSGWGEQQAGDTWGATTNSGGGGWGQTGNDDWGKKAASGAEAGGGTRNAVSPQQISQIYNSFLNTGQTQNLKTQGQQQSKKMAPSKQNNHGVWEAESGWGSESDEEGGAPRRVRFSPKASELWGGSPRSVPAKTMAAAEQQGLTTTLINDTSSARFVESRGAGLAFVSNAFFGNARLSRERIYWLFPQDKDQRISALLAWVQKMSFNLGTYGLMKFLEHGERGGLIVNAAFRMRQHPHEPAFDFLTFDQLQGTMDKTLQESVAFYDPARFAMAFVFLPSQSGNSVAIWRRKINVPDSARQKYRAQIEATVKLLRTPEEYIVMVDELPKKPKATTTTTHKPGQLRKPAKTAKTANAKATNNMKSNVNAAKSRKWWKFFLT